MKKNIVKKVIIAFFIIGIIVIFYYLKSILNPVFFAIIIAYILNPLVKLLYKKGISKRVAVLISMLILISFFVILLYYIIPGISKDIMGILQNSDEYMSGINKYLGSINIEGMPSYLKESINFSLKRLQGAGIESLNNFFQAIVDFTMELPGYSLTPIFIYYFLIDGQHFINLINNLIPLSIRKKTKSLWYEIDSSLSSFIRSQLFLSLIISIMTFFAMIILKVKFPLIIAFINGFTNIIPYFGPVIGLLPAFLSALTESFSKALMVLAAFIIIQQLESALIAPKIMGESLGIHPVFIMIILLAGGKYFGVAGLLFSIPLAAIIKIIARYTLKNIY